MATDLRFVTPLDTDHPVGLIFGVEDGGPPDAAVVTFAITLAPPTMAMVGETGERDYVTFNIGLPMPTMVMEAAYDNAVTTGPQGVTVAGWQVAAPTGNQSEMPHQQATKLQPNRTAAWGAGTPTPSDAETTWQTNTPLRREVGAPWQEGSPVRGSAGGRWQVATRRGSERRGRWQEGTYAGTTSNTRWQERARLRHQLKAPWQEGTPARRDLRAPAQEAVRHHVHLKAPWQEAMKPLPGRSIIIPPEPPVDEPCYTPPDGNAVHLLFRHLWDGSTNLLFSCVDEDAIENPALVVVPIRRVYMVINETSLWRVDGDVHIPTYSASMSLDVDSWTWSFSASVPADALTDIEPSVEGVPVELEVRLNGMTFRVYAESLSRDRVFAQSRINIRGRGKTALLDAPYAPIQSYGNDVDRLAQQLMADVLTTNGVPIGWDVDWQLTDWLVPAGAWAGQGTYMAALNQIAAAAGGYIQPHRTDQEIKVLHRYPFAPWEWDTEVTPDFELPSAVTTREGIEWLEKARYNRVYVSGQTGGVLGRVTRTGTDGALLAQMVTDPLITHADAARQRGRAILSDTGRQARVSLRLPVLEATGVIEPGKWVRYVDGGTTRLGIVRSTSVDIGKPDVWQTLGIETHVN